MENNNSFVDDVKENVSPPLQHESSPGDTPPPLPLKIVKQENLNYSDQIYKGAEFPNFATFEKALIELRQKHRCNFRVGSSETLKNTSGCIDPKYRYKYAVYNCHRYGKPRCRGQGKRPNQHYLPSNCPAKLRLNYNYIEGVLKITTICLVHNHDLTIENMKKKSQQKNKGGKATRKSRQRRQRGRVNSVEPRELMASGVENEVVTASSQVIVDNVDPVPSDDVVVPSLDAIFAAIRNHHQNQSQNQNLFNFQQNLLNNSFLPLLPTPHMSQFPPVVPVSPCVEGIKTENPDMKEEPLHAPSALPYLPFNDGILATLNAVQNNIQLPQLPSLAQNGLNNSAFLANNPLFPNFPVFPVAPAPPPPPVFDPNFLQHLLNIMAANQQNTTADPTANV